MSLIAYYPLDKDGKDYSGNGYDGTVNGVSFVSGKVNQAGDFEESESDRITLPNEISSFIKNTFTFSMWFNSESITANGNTFIGMGVVFFQIKIQTSNIIRVSLGNGTTWEHHDLTYSISTSTDYHLVVTWSGSQLKIYINKNLEYDQSTTYTSIDDVNLTTITIGSYLNDSRYFFDGQLDDLRFYDHALSTAEITDLFNMGSDIAVQIQGVVHTSKFYTGEFSDVDHSYRINYADLLFSDNSDNDLVTQLNDTGNKRLEIFNDGTSIYTGIVEDWHPTENNRISLYSIDYALLLLGEYIPSYDCNGQTASTIITDIIDTYDVDGIFTKDISSTTKTYNDVFAYTTPLGIMAELALRENYSLRLSPILQWVFQDREDNDLGITYTEGEDFLNPDFPSIRHKIKNQFYAVDSSGTPYLRPDLTSQANNYSRPSMTDLPDATSTDEVRDYLNSRARRHSKEVIPGSIKIPQNFSVTGTGLIRLNYALLGWTNRLLYVHAVIHSLETPFTKVELATFDPDYDEGISDLLIENTQLKKRNITGTLQIIPELEFEIAVEVTVTVERQDTSNFTWNESGQDDVATWNSTPTAWNEIVAETSMEVMNRYLNKMRDLLQGEAVTALDADNTYIELGSGTTSVTVVDSALDTAIAGTDGDMDAGYPRDGADGEAEHQTSYSDSNVVSFAAQEIALLENNNLMARVVLNSTFTKSEDQNVRVKTTTKYTDGDPTEIMTRFLNRVRDQLQGKAVTDADNSNAIMEYGSGTTGVTPTDSDLDTPIAGTSQGMEAGFPEDGVAVGQAWFESLIEDADVTTFEAREAGFFIDTELMCRVVFPAKLKKLSGSDVRTRGQVTFERKV